MKTLLFILLTAAISSVTFAQSYKQIPRFNKIEFGKQNNKEARLLFPVSPAFQKDNFSYNSLRKSKPVSPRSEKSMAYQLKMPVLGAQFPENMPVAVPDSTVKFYIKELQIEFSNPLER